MGIVLVLSLLPPISSVSTSSGSSRLVRRALLGSLKSLLGALPMSVPGLTLKSFSST